MAQVQPESCRVVTGDGARGRAGRRGRGAVCRVLEACMWAPSLFSLRGGAFVLEVSSVLRVRRARAQIGRPVVGAADFFFFQAEDGIRDWSVTGVQTCALPI